MNYKHGKARSAEHCAWKSAKGRCYNKKDKMYKNYGARGITMYDDWRKNFAVFFQHVGPRPEGTSLDRIDNNKGYVPGNVRWANDFEQAKNKTNNLNYRICCQIHHLKEWARIFGVDYKKAHERITKEGKNIIQALSTRDFLKEIRLQNTICNPRWCKHTPQCDYSWRYEKIDEKLYCKISTK